MPVAFSGAMCNLRPRFARSAHVRFPSFPELPCDMDSFEFNKIAAAVLATALFVMALSIVSEIIYEPAKPAKPGYVVAIVEPERAPAGGGGESIAPIAARLQTASVT